MDGAYDAQGRGGTGQALQTVPDGIDWYQFRVSLIQSQFQHEKSSQGGGEGAGFLKF